MTVIYSALIPTAFVTAVHFTISARMKRLNVSGLALDTQRSLYAPKIESDPISLE